MIPLKNLMNSNYKRPKTTTTDLYQNKKAMEEKLKDYERAASVDDIDYKTHVRYVTLDKEGKMVFRLGGLLIKKNPEYVKLSNGTFQWSVQRHHFDDADTDKKNSIFETVFFYHRSKKSTKIQIQELKIIIDEQDNEIEDLKEKYVKVKSQLLLTKKELKRYRG